VQFTIEGLFAIRKSKFQDYPAIPPELDLVEREDQITFELGLDDDIDKEEMLDIFRYDPNHAENEKLWLQVKKEILGDDEEEEDGEYAEEEVDQGDEGYAGAGEVAGTTTVIDLSEQDLINLRRTIYLTIMSSVSFEECVHKITKLNIPEGHEHELCNMIVECCANEKSYLKFYGLIGQRLCMLQKRFQNSFDEVFLSQYSSIHRLETNKLRNVAKYFAHLLATDALPWTCLEYIKLNEDDTTSSSRIFIKILAQELSEAMGLLRLKERFEDPYMAAVFAGLFPRDNARNTRFAINFFTSVGLGGLTDSLREHLKNLPKLMAQQVQSHLAAKDSSSDSSSDSSDSSSSDSDSDSDSDSSSSSSSSDSSSSDSSSTSSSASSVSRHGAAATKKGKGNAPSVGAKRPADEREGVDAKRARPEAVDKGSIREVDIGSQRDRDVGAGGEARRLDGADDRRHADAGLRESRIGSEKVRDDRDDRESRGGGGGYRRDERHYYADERGRDDRDRRGGSRERRDGDRGRGGGYQNRREGDREREPSVDRFGRERRRDERPDSRDRDNERFQRN
jgi:pre-mRNA-splicing factor CWC22